MTFCQSKSRNYELRADNLTLLCCNKSPYFHYSMHDLFWLVQLICFQNSLGKQIANKPNPKSSSSFCFIQFYCVPIKSAQTFLTLLLLKSPGGYLTKFYKGRLRPEAQPLTLSYTILAEKVPLLYTFYWKKVPLSHTYFRKSCSSFHVVLNKWTSTTLGASIRKIIIKGPFKYLNDRFPYPFIYLNLWNPYPFLYLKPEKGTPFGRSLLV